VAKDNIKFVTDLIKGKITEVIFQQMFSEVGNFTVIPFGYENTIPELAQYHNLILPKVVGNFNKMPDFVLIKGDKTEAYLVEIKYRSEIDIKEMYNIALETVKSWDPSFLFIATKGEFYYSPCNRIIINKGKLEPLGYGLVKKDLQEKYTQILSNFIA
jgi:hypothetical protein